MARVVVEDGLLLPQTDPSAVWALLADPSRITEWAPVRDADFMGTELPGVGHTAFVRVGRRAKPEASWRCRIVAWHAGTHYACEMDTPGLASHQRLDVSVAAEIEEGHPSARVALRYAGRVPWLLAAPYRWRVGTLVRRALWGIENVFGEPE